MIVRLGMGAALAILTAGSSRTQIPAEMKRCPADRALTQLAAQSDLIVVGTLAADTAAVLAGSAQTYVSLTVNEAAALKGSLPDTLTIRFFAEESPDRPSFAALTAHAGASILFLQRAEGALYFAGHSPEALQAAAAGEIARTRTEIARQNAILSEWRVDRRLPHFREAQALIRRLGTTDAEAQRRIFTAIEKLGAPAVPAIVALMDDRRPLADPAITLVNNHADAFEGMRHYGPELVVDALAAILNQLSGASFGQIYNGGSEAERRAAVSGWRVYAADLACPDARGG